MQPLPAVASLDSADIRIDDSPRLTDNVYQGLRKAIIDGQLPAGTRLSVPALARRFNVSRSPIREAVARLTTDRLAVEQPRRGAVVTEVSLHDLVEVYQAREALEGAAARLAASHCDDVLRARLEELMRQHRGAVDRGDDAARAQLDSAFHRAIADASRNKLIRDWHSQLQARVQIAMRTTAISAGVAVALADHEKIRQAITSGDPVTAEATARAHIARLRHVLDQAVQLAATEQYAN